MPPFRESATQWDDAVKSPTALDIQVVDDTRSSKRAAWIGVAIALILGLLGLFGITFVKSQEAVEFEENTYRQQVLATCAEYQRQSGLLTGDFLGGEPYDRPRVAAAVQGQITAIDAAFDELWRVRTPASLLDARVRAQSVVTEAIEKGMPQVVSAINGLPESFSWQQLQDAMRPLAISTNDQNARLRAAMSQLAGAECFPQR